MEKSRFIELVRKKEGGEISLLELKELNDAVADTPLYASILKRLQSLSEDQPLFNKQDHREVNDALKRLNERIFAAPVKKRVHVLKRLLVAAAVLLLLGMGVLGIWYSAGRTKESSSLNEIATEKGSKTTITLPDGSRVWINAATRLTYDHSFGEKTRSVFLTGEAYFEVAKDKQHPFIVHTATADVRAVGTSFNVRSYPGEGISETTLLTGIVDVFLKKGTGEKIRLKPMEKLLVKNEQYPQSSGAEEGAPEIAVIKIIQDSTQDALPETAWIKNRLIFKQMKLRDIARELERCYNSEVIIRDSALLDRRLSGSFRQESLEAILETFKLAAGINYKIEGGKVQLFQ
ncbi:hypothetical protein A8C56_15725 [Niabella ginsenosidivorans]|uniref:FecR protein domain-containing protein n=1 Tax=Niabella ginsenosidivorans TaxID=1176587 RepID=A0A1A9I3G8_9BACT|nr:FecR domain-containing protein [Niabella ginsenosidivorans]ANH82217.1 hypothetical protein A8C56_15725 [Niabella ginsenosidivorans]